MSIFDKRVAFKPFEYPEVSRYKDAINHSYWLVSEWTFVADVQDFRVLLSPAERSAIKNALLAISQIEVSVKRFWAKLGERFPKPEVEQVGMTFAECFADGTEVLTPSGWVDLAEVSVGDQVLQYHENGTFSFTPVKHKTDQLYKGPMCQFHKRSTEAVVTPNHRMVYYNHKGEFKESPADELSMRNSSLFIPESGTLVGGSRSTLSFIERLRLVIQADGNRRYYNSGYGRKPRMGNGAGAEYEIRISKPRKIERLDWIMEGLNGEVEFSKRPIPSKPGMFCYTIRIDGEHDYKQLDWVDLADKSAAWCLDFVEELAEWDGYRLLNKKDCKIKFSSTNKRAADVAQMVGVCAGYRTHMGYYEDNRKESHKPTFILSFTTNRRRVSLPPLKRNEVEYDGWVRCVTVDSGAVITRYHGKTFISGNSEVRHADAYSHLLEVLGLNGDFELLLDNPVIQGRVDYLTKYLRGAADSSHENYTLSLALFSIFIENVSLFSQFLIIKSFNKCRNLLKDIDNVIQATMREEAIHAMLGAYLIELVKKERPDWFDENFYAKLRRACLKAYEAESAIIDWIFEEGELPFLPKHVVKEFIKHRFNESMGMLNAEKVFEVDEEAVGQLRWFDEEIHADTNTDFFHKKPVTYAKMVQAYTAESIFS